MWVYLDNAATTPLLPEVKSFLCELLNTFGNPSSVHKLGKEAREALEGARERLANILGVEPSEVVFNSGATEGNNSVLMDPILRKKEGNVIISPVEHKSVTKPAERLKNFGVEVRVLRVDRNGIVDIESLEDLLDEKTLLVSVMSVSNEFGVLQPVEEVARLCAERGVPFHTDAVQALGKVPLSLDHVSFATFSGHKFHAPKGVGFMVVREGLVPLLVGGGQEKGLRSGTENLQGILAMVKALEVIYSDFERNIERLISLRDLFEKELTERLPDVRVVGGDVVRSPSVSAVILPELPGAEVVRRLSEEGVFCSSGSACSGSEPVPNEHLLTMGYSYEEATRIVRFSFGLLNTEEEVLTAVDKLCKIVRG